MRVSFTLHHQHLTIHWSPQRSINYWYSWLYDNAPGNWHQNGQKLTESRAIDMNIRPIDIRLSSENLDIRWPDKEVVYPISWLKKYDQQRPMDYHILWDKHDEHSIHSHQEILSNPRALLDCLKDILIYGFTRIDGVPRKPSTVLDLVTLFGYVRETNYGKYYDVITESEPENLANSALGLAPHTDNPYRYPTPTIQLLHCLDANVEGGDTILVDGFNLAKKIEVKQPQLYRLLCAYPIKFKFETRSCLFEHTAPILELDSREALRSIRFNNRSVQPFELSDEVMLPYYKAYQYFERLLNQESNQVRFKLEPGQAIIFDNERILHGRTSFKSLTKRHLQGCYADRDALLSTIAVLKRDLH